jgi:hypothetical protein
MQHHGASELKLLFSEATPDYGHYVFPYAVWAFPEPAEKAQQFFERGFLPSSKNFDRYYLCRSVRVNLRQFQPSSENRRILRKGGGITYKLLARDQFAFTETWKSFCLRYADDKFGKGVMNDERLANLFDSPITSHLLVFQDGENGPNVGLVTLFLDEPFVAQYYYAFYDLNYHRRNLGMFMMTSAVSHFAGERWHYLYLGSCYSSNAFYKTQFTGAEFFNGARWSQNLDELKHLIARHQTPQTTHLFESSTYLHEFYDGELGKLVEASLFRIPR